MSAFHLTPAILLRAYASGLFPMAESAEAEELYWYDPEQRGILPLDHFHVPRRLRRTVRAGRYTIKADSAFAAVVTACAAVRPTTWINREIAYLYGRLHELGHAHSIEAWLGETLVGGLYGVSLGGAFFGESMFSLARDASKVALIHLVARLRRGGFTLLDTQFVTEHLSQFGAVEIPRDTYLDQLAVALNTPADFCAAALRPEDFDALFAAG